MNSAQTIAGSRQETREYRVFLFSVCLAVVLCVSVVILGMVLRSRDQLQGEMLARARAGFASILSAHRWGSAHGGVWVEADANSAATAGSPENVHRSTDGKVYIRKAPAALLREMAQALESPGMQVFRLTSLRPIDPQNRPDPFEERSLKRFEAGESEAYAREEFKGANWFRYMALLRMEKSCLQCHANQSYRFGEIRGGISVSFPAEELERRERNDLLAICISGLLTIGLVVSLILYLFARMEKRLQDSRLSLETMASLDGLTGLYNRRTLDRRFAEELTRHRRKGQHLACLLGDLDHFRQINDESGHLSGDEILKQVAGVLSGSLRNYDIVGRFGGEEFLILLPETPIDSAAVIAGRLRSRISDQVITRRDKAGSRSVTISFGVAGLRETDLKTEELLNRADAALLRAKENGRNRVEITN